MRDATVGEDPVEQHLGDGPAGLGTRDVRDATPGVTALQAQVVVERDAPRRAARRPARDLVDERLDRAPAAQPATRDERVARRAASGASSGPWTAATPPWASQLDETPRDGALDQQQHPGAARRRP